MTESSILIRTLHFQEASSLIAIYLALKATTNSKRTKIFERIISLSAILIFVSYIGNPSTANSKTLDKSLSLTKVYKKMILHFKEGDKNVDTMLKEGIFHYNSLEK